MLKLEANQYLLHIMHCKKDILPQAMYRMHPKVSGLAVWSKNCKWYSSLPLGAIVPLFCESG
jgi:hypothetical protein